MAHNFTLSVMKSLKHQFLSIRTVHALCELLNIPEQTLPQIIQSITYRNFKQKKKSGGYRTIEDPYNELKEIQDTLNDYLQCVYFFCLPKGAHGFVATPDNDIKQKRNILSNAKVHLGSNYLLNIDLLDFFHHVTDDKIHLIFEQAPFHMEQPLIELLIQLVSYNGRLPMGAPTSPVLSNFALIHLDKVLHDLAGSKKWYYSRFVDDMSFSSALPITQHDVHELDAVIIHHGFKMNKSKIKFYGLEDIKVITGISLINDQLSLSDSYLNELRKELQNLKHMNLVNGYYRTEPPSYMDKYKKSLQGRLQFVKMVLGANQSAYKELNHIWIHANQIKQEEYGAMSWLDFDY